MNLRILSSTKDLNFWDTRHVDEKKPFAECFRKALVIWGVDWYAPEIQTFLDRRAKDLGVPHPAKGRQTVYNWMAGKKPTPEGYAALAKLLNVSCRWLIEGEGDMRRSTKLSPGQAEVVEIFNELRASPSARDGWVSQGRTLVELVAPQGKANPFRKQ